MIFFILFFVAVYCWLVVYILAKTGSSPAKSVIEVFQYRKTTPDIQKKLDKHRISTR